MRDGGAESGAIYFADAELNATNYSSVGDFFVEYTTGAEYTQITDLITANTDPITVVYQEVAVEKTLDEVKAMFADINYFYVDMTEKVVVFKVVDADVDMDNYLFDSDYKITYTEDTELTSIQAAITEYNATAEADAQITQTTAVVTP